MSGNWTVGSVCGIEKHDVMRCFYLPDKPLQSGQRVALPQRLVKHLGRVLRLTAGNRIELFDGCGRVAEAVLLDEENAEIEQVSSCPPPPCRLTLIQGLPKSDKLELILQKGTELGVETFRLVEMERSVGRMPGKKEARKRERWERIIEEAARQCRQFYLPKLVIDDSFSEALVESDADLKMLLWEERRQEHSGVHQSPAPQSIAVVVGPEGGISRKEAEQAELLGFCPVGLGPRILRTETAGLAILSILQYLYGDLAPVRRR